MLRQSLIRICALSVAAFAAASLFMFGQGRPARDSELSRPYVSPTPGELPIIAGYAFNIDSQLTRSQFELAAKAGFNICDALYVDTLQFWKALEACKGTGVKVAINIVPTRRTATCGSWARRLRNNPDVAYYEGADEAPMTDFAYWRPVCDSLYKNDPNHMLTLNLLPEVSPKQLGAPDYRTYLNAFVDILDPPLISFDFYPVKKSVKGNIYVASGFYNTIEQVFDVCRKRRRVMWGYLLSSPHANYPTPTKSHLRFAAFTQLGYGTQGFSYFTYAYPAELKEDYRDSPLDSLGRPTGIWKTVRDVNREIRNLQKIFLGCKVIDVSHTGDRLPKGTHRLGVMPEPFTQLLSGPEGVMVSHFRNGDREYLLLVNHSVTEKQKLRLDVIPGADIRRYYGNGRTKRYKSSTLTLDPGGYALFGWAASVVM